MNGALQALHAIFGAAALSCCDQQQLTAPVQPQQGDVADDDELNSPAEAPFSTARDTSTNIGQLAQKIETNSSGLGFRSDEIMGVSHDSVWRSMMLSLRDPARFFPCSGVSIKECSGFVQRIMTAGSETYAESIYIDEVSCEMAFRELVNGAETDIERVVALRSQPLRLEFHQYAADGSREQWDMPKSAPLSSVDAFVREASRMEGEN